MPVTPLDLAGGAVGASAFGLFNYNRGNFQFDQTMRFQRFTTARQFAIAQTEQYRGDLRQLTTLTTKKNGLYAVVASLCMALCIALYCAGRLGLHGPSPPFWIIGLWYTNTAAAFSYMALTIWLAMHASFRAQAASVHLLTRKTRVPVPTLKQLDKARRFGSEFEQQDFQDIFRVPYIMGNGAPRTDEAAGSSARSSSAPPGRSRMRGDVSSWVREEFSSDRAGTLTGASPFPPDMAPEHFQLYTEAQKEWFAYDVYARIAALYGMLSFVHGLSYYGLGHINIELRAFWVAYANGFILMVLHCLLLRFDIVAGRVREQDKLPYCQWLGAPAWLCAAIAMSLDFRVQFSLTAVALTWVFVFLAYFFQLIYSLRLLELCLPDDWRNQAKPEERIGASWWPESWSLPSNFQHVLYLVAPPRKLQVGQNDIVREVKEGIGHDDKWGEAGEAPAGLKTHADLPSRQDQDMQSGYDSAGGYSSTGSAGSGSDTAKPPAGSPISRAKDAAAPWSQTAHIQPWRLVSSIMLALSIAWALYIIFDTVDLILGEQALVTAPHWSRPPMTRLSLEPHELGTPWGFPWPAGTKPWLPEQMAWHEEKRHAHHVLLGGERRLSVQPGFQGLGGGAGFSAALDGLLSVLSRETAAAGRVNEAVSWPGFFEPQLLACGPSAEEGSFVAALTPRGVGAATVVGRKSQEKFAAEPFTLSGIAHLPPLLGATWGSAAHDGLLLVTRGGHLVGCPGSRPAAGNAWACHPVGGAPLGLPVAKGARLAAAAAAWLPGHGGSGGAPLLHVALVDERSPDLVGLFVQDGEGEASSWLPFGEMLVPGGRKAAVRTFLAFNGGDLLVSTASGAVLQRRLRDGATLLSSAAGAAADGAWRAACALQHGPAGGLAHLHLPKAASGLSRRPELVTARLTASAVPNSDIFQ